MKKTIVRSKRAQAAAEYLIFFGVVVFVTLISFGKYIPKITDDYTGEGEMPYAVKYLSNVVQTINAN